MSCSTVLHVANDERQRALRKPVITALQRIQLTIAPVPEGERVLAQRFACSPLASDTSESDCSERARPNTRLKLAAPLLYNHSVNPSLRYRRIAFVRLTASRRSLSAIR